MTGSGSGGSARPAALDQRLYTLQGLRGPYRSTTPGLFGGHRGQRVYGRLDCPSARRSIARGHYVRQRVFFADEAAARAAGYRPCAVCMPAGFAAWKKAPRRPGAAC